MARLAVPLAALALGSPVEGRPMPPLVTAQVWSPAPLQGTYLGRAANFSALPIPAGAFRIAAPSDPTGCDEYTLPVQGVAVVALVRAGDCSFLRKALRAQSAGASGVVILSEALVLMTAAKNQTTANMGIFAVSMKAADGDPLLQHLETAGQPAVISFQVYKPHMKGISLAVLICGATALVLLGAYFSTVDLSRPFKVTVLQQQQRITGQQVVTPLRGNGPLVASSSSQGEGVTQGGAMSGFDGLLFCVAGSAMLLAMYFFMQYMIYGIIGIFCLVGFFSLTVIGSWLLVKLIPSLGRPICCQVVNSADVVCAVLALIVVLGWLHLQSTDWGWPLQDLMGLGFLLLVQQALQLPNLKVATIVLSVMFCFDIFWVFISPLLFGQSVMVKAATSPVHGLTVPMLLRVPSFTDPFGRDRMLGFGDIAAPGLLVSYLLRWDLWNRRQGLCSGYFMPAVVGYFLGLCTCVASLLLMHMAQPALLYLVPGTLGLTLLLSTCRGDLASLWRGLPEDYGKPWSQSPPYAMNGLPQPQYMQVPQPFYA